MARLTLALGLAAALIASAASADEAEDRAAFRALVAENTYILETDGTHFAGPAYDFILREGSTATHFLFAEQHATSDIPHLAASIWRDLSDEGFTVATIEIGPYSTPVLEEMLRAGTYRDYASSPGNTLVIPFAFFEEEAQLLDTVIASSPRESHVLWGVDQEFIASGPIIADILEGHARTRAQHDTVDAFRAGVAANPMYIGMTPAGSFDDLAAAFADAGPEVNGLIEELNRTNRIYSPFTGRGGNIYDGNYEREYGMRANFLTHAEDLQDRERIFFKFGANHLQRGRSNTNVPSFGGFINEWAFMRGETTFSLVADCRSGMQRDPRSGEESPCDAYFLENAPELAEAIPEGAVLIDLRPLRSHALSWDFLDPGTEMLIFSFDAYLALPDVLAAHMIGG